MSEDTIKDCAFLVQTEPTDDLSELDKISRFLRYWVVRMSHEARTPHLGSSLSCLDIVTVAYWSRMRLDCLRPKAADRDRFILSKGHAATALYATLCARGFFPKRILDSYAQPGSCLSEHPGPWCAPGIEAATGSLGHGLPIGLGMALGIKLARQDSHVFVVMSDGECNEGSVWEAALFAPAKGLCNVCVVVDYNKWQATGRSQEVMALHPLADKWRAFGWSVQEIDGHDLGQIQEAMKAFPDGSGKPKAIIAHTTKGKGISFMEDDNNWHYRIPTADEVEVARKELGVE